MGSTLKGKNLLPLRALHVKYIGLQDNAFTSRKFKWKQFDDDINLIRHLAFLYLLSGVVGWCDGPG